jgi:uncharacterized protein (DUF169 family)
MPYISILHKKHHHMDTGIRDRFVTLWQTSCPGAELPITFEVGEDRGTTEKAKTPKGWRCFICDLARVRKGTSLVFDRTSVTCSGGLFYLGYDTQRSENFRYFLSSGKPGVVEGERYKRRPEIIDEINACHVSLPAEGRCYTFRRWDMLTPEDNPDVVIFFARPEVLSALFTLANFDQANPVALPVLLVPGAPRSSTIPGLSRDAITPGQCSGCSIRQHVPVSRWMS